MRRYCTGVISKAGLTNVRWYAGRSNMVSMGLPDATDMVGWIANDGCGAALLLLSWGIC